MPLVSVIVPAYKVTLYIAETLDSILAQTFQDFEIVVINDGCPDSEALEKVLETYRPRITYLRQENQGPAAARNTAIRATSDTKFIALLDGDDKWHPEYLKVQTEIMDRDPKIDVLYCDAILFGGSRDDGRRFMQMCPSEGEVTLKSLADQTCTVMVSVLARREALIGAGLFDPILRSSEDFDLWARILQRGGRIAYHRQPLVYYRRRPDSLSASRVGLSRSFIRVLEKIGDSANLSAAERNSVQYRIEHLRAVIDWEEGRVAIARGDADEAASKLARANRTLRDPRLRFLIAALRFCPALAIRAYRMRSALHG